jgi:hypothetical protein
LGIYFVLIFPWIFVATHCYRHAKGHSTCSTNPWWTCLRFRDRFAIPTVLVRGSFRWILYKTIISVIVFLNFNSKLCKRLPKEVPMEKNHKNVLLKALKKGNIIFTWYSFFCHEFFNLLIFFPFAFYQKLFGHFFFVWYTYLLLSHIILTRILIVLLVLNYLFIWIASPSVSFLLNFSNTLQPTYFYLFLYFSVKNPAW